MLASEMRILQHPESACDLAGVGGGEKGDTGLTAYGRSEAALLAAQFAQETAGQLCQVYAGSQPRVRETAGIVASVLGVPLRREARLACQRFGPDVDGRPWTEVAAGSGGWPCNAPEARWGVGGESRIEYLHRLVAVLRILARRHPGQRVLVVGDSAHCDASLQVFLAASGSVEPVPAVCTRWRERPLGVHGPAAWCLVGHSAARLPTPGSAARMLERGVASVPVEYQGAKLYGRLLGGLRPAGVWGHHRAW